MDRVGRFVWHVDIDFSLWSYYKSLYPVEFLWKWPAEDKKKRSKMILQRDTWTPEDLILYGHDWTGEDK